MLLLLTTHTDCGIVVYGPSLGPPPHKDHGSIRQHLAEDGLRSDVIVLVLQMKPLGAHIG